MYIIFLAISIILSFLPFSDFLSKNIIKYKKYISIIIYVLCFVSFWFLLSNNHHNIHTTWELALSILWIILWLPILSKVFSLKIPKSLMIFRKELGILMWFLAIIHTILYFLSRKYISIFDSSFWIKNNYISYLAWWFFAIIITIILTITSNNFSIKKLWKNWKKLHRIVYILLFFTLLHVAFLKAWKWWNLNISNILITFIPFILYFVWKILEWKKIKIKMPFTK